MLRATTRTSPITLPAGISCGRSTPRAGGGGGSTGNCEEIQNRRLGAGCAWAVTARRRAPRNAAATGRRDRRSATGGRRLPRLVTMRKLSVRLVKCTDHSAGTSRRNPGSDSPLDPVPDGPAEELLDLDPVAAHEELALGREGGAEGRHAGELVGGAPALDLERRQPAAGPGDEVHLAVALPPV